MTSSDVQIRDDTVRYTQSKVCYFTAATKSPINGTRVPVAVVCARASTFRCVCPSQRCTRTSLCHLPPLSYYFITFHFLVFSILLPLFNVHGFLSSFFTDNLRSFQSISVLSFSPSLDRIHYNSLPFLIKVIELRTRQIVIIQLICILLIV